ncbi:MAG: ABC transporter ATP-binding protein [Firmicutes bacterium]|jgi:branched-chain amino acid transport system ATP-binding protein|nr:ABC transporter ATP-binding protein [Bacillota bacterium]
MLGVSSLKAYYGKAQALFDLSFTVPPGSMVALLGANGAGKTTTLMAISGLCRKSPDARIEFDGSPIQDLRPEEIVARGVIHVPQGRGIFPGLTVRENLAMGAYLRTDRLAVEEDMDRVLELFPQLKERIGQAAGTLSGGEQQMLAIMRGMMARPKLLMLDEPSMGLAPRIVEQVYEVLQEINRAGTTILLVEQNTHMALTVSHYAYILSVGRIVLEGSAADLLAKEDMLKTYFRGQGEGGPAGFQPTA